MNGSRKYRATFDEEIERRLTSPEWDEKIVQKVTEYQASKRRIHLGMAAGILFFTGFLAAGLYLRTSGMQTTSIVNRFIRTLKIEFPDNKGSASTAGSIYTEMQITDSNAFPYREDREISILLGGDAFGD